MSEFIDRIAEAQKKQGYNVNCSVPDYIKFSVRPLAFERCISNLMINACKYAKNVWISAEYSQDNRVEILIDDDGPGIPADKYDDVFRPFFRLDASRNTETGGVGLGMPIAMDIVHAHGGRIWLDKSPYGGLRVSVRLPV